MIRLTNWSHSLDARNDMKQLVIHGDDIEKSRKRLQKFIDVAHTRKWDVVKISGKSDNIADAISANNLFDTPRLIVVEEAQTISKEVSKWFIENEKKYDDTICFFATKTLTPTQLKVFRGAKVELFETPNLVWMFLDSLQPQNAQSSINLLHQIIQTEAPEFVFAMIARHLRDMYHVLCDKETFVGPDWRKRKLMSQASQFGEESLKTMMQELSEIDVRTKTSDSSLTDELDFLFMKYLHN